jgi:hypothetical protein
MILSRAMFLPPPPHFLGKNFENTEYLALKQKVKVGRGIRVCFEAKCSFFVVLVNLKACPTFGSSSKYGPLS